TPLADRCTSTTMPIRGFLASRIARFSRRTPPLGLTSGNMRIVIRAAEWDACQQTLSFPRRRHAGTKASALTPRRQTSAAANGRRRRLVLTRAIKWRIKGWSAGLAGASTVDMMDNASALPTCPQPQQQQQTEILAA